MLKIKNKDLVKLLNIAPSYASEILSGKKRCKRRKYDKNKRKIPTT